MLSDSRFAQVVYNLRDANAYFYAEARCYRAFHKPTHYAKRRAIRLNLNVDTRKAMNMPTIEAYCRHDPLIIQTYSPIAESNAHANTNGWVSGPTNNELLNINAALSEYLSRINTAGSSGTRDEPLHRPPTRKGYGAILRPLPDVPLDIAVYPDLTRSSSSSSSSSMITTPKDKARPLTVRTNLKRRSPCDVEDADNYVEKRPKYGRKHWVPAPAF
ncbi:hypothetical protein D9756_004295 [Leucocoprinus leucothites]|uniref:Uncharacterized protein n=1 Tax=Leucocoprinus leucothites TaxID=201217 RepID=A0A8H5D8Y5_9AGAR|nr:hypothetical protein D9756_004295 [Leucoagaricus leucothites]